MGTPKTTPGFCLGVVILAAGKSARMGSSKLLLTWGQSSVLGHLISEWRALGAAQIKVVCTTNDHPLHEELDRQRVEVKDRIFNPAPESGMFSSIQCAARADGWTEALTHWAIILGDQPHLRRDSLSALVAHAISHPAVACQPSRGGKPRHPVILPRKLFREIPISTTSTLKEFLHMRPKSLCELEDQGLDLDIDRPEDYQRALALAGMLQAD